jgi:ABC-type nitrate/sulfonate/bicarbonate transport system substrate-binding protein
MSVSFETPADPLRFEVIKELVTPGKTRDSSAASHQGIRATLTRIKTFFCLILFALLAQAASAAQAEPIRLAYSSISGAMAPLWVAQDYGYFRGQGLDVQLLYIGGGSVATQALIGGDVQFVRLGANSVVQASLRGASLKMIGNTINTLVFSLMARPEIQTPKDFTSVRTFMSPKAVIACFEKDNS